MKIVSVNTTDVGGGAERMAWNSFKGFEARGHESWLVVGDKKSSDPRVLPFHQSPFIDYRPYAPRLYQLSLQARRRVAVARGRDDFNYPYTRRVLDIAGARPDAVLLHNLHGGYFDLRGLETLSERVPVFLSLHDSWTFTGHCAFAIDCPGWKKNCDPCPDIASPIPLRRDGAAANLAAKRRIFARSRLRVATASRWMMERVQASALGRHAVDTQVIPYGIDTDALAPADSAVARKLVGRLVHESFGIVPTWTSGRILLCDAHSPFRKRHDRLIRMFDALPAGPLTLVSIGHEEPDARASCEALPGEKFLLRLPLIPHELFCRLLQACDLFLHDPREESFGVVLIEAMAAGKPVVATRTGGIPEVISSQEGILVDPDASFVEPVAELLASASRRASLGEAGRARAVRDFDHRLMAARYLDWMRAALGPSIT